MTDRAGAGRADFPGVFADPRPIDVNSSTSTLARRSRSSRSAGSGSGKATVKGKSNSGGGLGGIAPGAIVPALVAWFAGARRELPWREPARAPLRRDPYRVLVSEVMLQQTQVARVVPKFRDFVARFPDARSLAGAPLDDVLAAWTGLGYYRRARMLHAAAGAVVERHGGVVPGEPEAVRALPGVGAYTAGAVLSLAFNQAEPLVDANVSRVLLRVGGVALRADEPEARAWCWEQARGLVREAAGCGGGGRAGDCNEALMELGALVCTPRSPACGVCPLRDACVARAKGTQEEIPRKKARAARTQIVHAVALVRDQRGRVLVEQRPARGLWAGLWQAPTVELGAGEADASAGEMREKLEAHVGAGALRLPARAAEDFVFHTTHRAVRFVVFAARDATDATRAKRMADGASGGARRAWIGAGDLASMGFPSPQLRVLRAALGMDGDGGRATRRGRDA